MSGRRLSTVNCLVLEKLASDKDSIVAANARWSLTTPVTDKDVKDLLEQTK